jgi:enoyl-CoA hydratase/carnithine racemase
MIAAIHGASPPPRRTSNAATRRAIAYNLRNSFDPMLAMKRSCAKVLAHADAREGVRAFGEKRKPRFADD